MNCTCGRTHQGLIKRSADEAFATAEAAAYPEEMDLQIGWALWHLPTQSPPSVSPSVGPLKSHEGGKQQEQGQEEGQERKRLRNEQDKTLPAEGEGGAPTAEEIDDLIEKAKTAAQEEMRLGENEKEEERREAGGEKRAGGVRKAPIQVHYKGRVRNLVDGLGKCSPGIRPAGARGVSQNPPARLLAKAFMEEVERLEASMSQEERRSLISRLVLGRFSSSPFEKGMEEVRSRLDEKVLSLGKDPRRKNQDRVTAINFRRLKAWAQLTEDEDWMMSSLDVKSEKHSLAFSFLLQSSCRGFQIVELREGHTIRLAYCRIHLYSMGSIVYDTDFLPIWIFRDSAQR